MNENEKAPAGVGALTEAGMEWGHLQTGTDSMTQYITPQTRTQGVIEGILPRGAKNAVSSKALTSLVGCRSVRRLQRLIEQEREQGAVILSSTTGGYYRPSHG